MTDKPFSEEFLNAFVDNQLDPAEKGRAYPVVMQDAGLSREVCELRKVRDLVQLSYQDATPPAPSQRVHARMRLSEAAAAVALFALGLSIGWATHAHNPFQSAQHSAQSLALGKPIPRPIPSLDAKATTKVLFHLGSGKRRRMEELLDDVEDMLRTAKVQHKSLRVDVIANGDGLNLLRADTSPFAARIRALSKKYPNLTFAACQNTIDRLKREQGIQARLLPQAVVIDSGVAQIILLQQRGWAYIEA